MNWVHFCILCSFIQVENMKVNIIRNLWLKKKTVNLWTHWLGKLSKWYLTKMKMIQKFTKLSDFNSKTFLRLILVRGINFDFDLQEKITLYICKYVGTYKLFSIPRFLHVKSSQFDQGIFHVFEAQGGVFFDKTFSLLLHFQHFYAIVQFFKMNCHSCME